MKSILTAALLCTAAGLASASTVVVSGIGGGLSLGSKDLTGLGVFSSSAPTFSSSDLQAVNTELNSNGIVTNGFVTFLLADVLVNGQTKLAFMALVDDENGTGSGTVSKLGMTTTANGSNVEWINDNGGDIVGSLGSTRAGDFRWYANGRGDGFAWSNLVAGDVMNFRFDKITTGSEITSTGLATVPFQFVSWNGSNWNVVSGIGADANGRFAFSQNNQFGFSAVVIPLPTPALLGIAGLGLAHIARRRFLKK